MKTLLPIVITLAFLGLLVASIWYVGARLCNLFELPSQWMIVTGVALVVVGSLAAIVAAVNSTSKFVSVLNVLGGYLFVFYLFVLIFLILLHAIQLIWNPPLVWSGLTVLALAFLVTIVGVLKASSFNVVESEIQIAELENELRIMQITDVHIGHHRGREYLEKIIEATNQRNPDLVLIAGDLVDSAIAFQPDVLAPLSRLKSPVYFVGGNHEEYVDSELAFKLIEQQGINVLHNEIIETHGIQLVGLNYMNADENTFDMHPSSRTGTIKSALHELPLKQEIPSILLHHSPVGFVYADKAGIDLMLSGHTHAGQVFPATLLAKHIFSMNRGFYQHGQTKVLVSQGAGTYMVRVRLGSSNEINLLHLVPSA